MAQHKGRLGKIINEMRNLNAFLKDHHEEDEQQELKQQLLENTAQHDCPLPEASS